MTKSKTTPPAANLVERIDAAIAVAQRDQEQAAADYAAASLKVIEQPGDANVHSALADLSKEQAEAAAKIKSLQAAREAAAARDSHVAKVAEVKALKENVRKVAANFNELSALVSEVKEKHAALFAVQGRISKLADQNRELSAKTVRAACGGDGKVALRYFGTLSLISAKMIAQGFERELGFAHDFGGPPLQDQMAKAAASVNFTLENLVARREQELAEVKS